MAIGWRCGNSKLGPDESLALFTFWLCEQLFCVYKCHILNILFKILFVFERQVRGLYFLLGFIEVGKLVVWAVPTLMQFYLTG